MIGNKMIDNTSNVDIIELKEKRNNFINQIRKLDKKEKQ